MNYYRRHIGDYLTATAGLSMREHGAYALLLDYYYSSEKPLALDPKSIFRIAHCQSAEDRKAVLRVLELFFVKADDGWRQKRADEEIEIATKAIEKQRISGKEAALKRWHGKVGEPIKLTYRVTHKEVSGSTDGSSGGSDMQPPTTSLQPNQETTPAIVDRTTAPESAAAGAVDLESLRIGLPAGSVEGDKAAELWACLHANGCKGTASHPSVIEMSRQGVTIDLLKRAIAEARKTREGPLNPAYLAAIIDRLKTERPAKHGAWMTSDHDCELKAAELGIKARPLETYGELRARIRAELEKRADASVR